MDSNRDSRARGVIVYVMPQEVCGPSDRYALLVREGQTGPELRMVHYQGVSYLVNEEKPWVWTDYNPDVKKWTVDELLALKKDARPVDLADWISVFGARLESNFYQTYCWATEFDRKN